MKIYNTLTRQKEEFVPMDGKNVKMYACGITVYDLSHIGHARQAIVYSMIADYLRFKGYNVEYVRNYTDVDDKIIKRANERKVNALDFSKEQIHESEIDMANLHVSEPDMYCQASEYINDIISFVQGLIDKGYGYATPEGNVYYSVRKFKDYGKLSHQSIDDMLQGVRKDLEQDKKDPADFALWKAAKEGEISWKSPWGQGRPGWHIECSTMILKNLGETIDIHGGGMDLVFPHHENEIAQSEGLTGMPFVKYWSHCGLLKINGEKMSKSLGNFITIRDALKKYDYEVLKYVMHSKHYRSDIDLLDSDFDVAEKHLYYFYNTLNKMNEYMKKYSDENEKEKLDNDISEKVIDEFTKAMDDDFNTALVLSNLFGYFKYINNEMKNKNDKAKRANTFKSIIETLKKTYGNILGIFTEEPAEFIKKLKQKYLEKIHIDSSQIEEKIEERNEAKKAKDFSKADSIRNLLDEEGIILMDTPEGTTWDIKSLM